MAPLCLHVSVQLLLIADYLPADERSLAPSGLIVTCASAACCRAIDLLSLAPEQSEREPLQVDTTTVG